MKLEMDEATAWSVVSIAFAACLTVGCLVGCHIVEWTKREAMKAGLVQKSEPGQSYPVWGKPDQK